MKGMVHRNDLMIVGTVFQVSVFSCYFDRTFDGFGSAVCEKYFGKSGCFYQFLCGFHHRYIVIQVGGMDHFINLILQRLIVYLIIVSQGKYRDSCCKVQIFFSVHIIQMDTVSFVQYDLETVIGMQNDFFCPVDIFFTVCHNL